MKRNTVWFMKAKGRGKNIFVARYMQKVLEGNLGDVVNIH